MLTRFLLGLLVCLPLAAAAQEPRPHVVLVRLAASAEAGPAPAWLEPKHGWKKTTGTCLASPGDSAIQTALLFGTPPLQQGVVKDLDWRRKPVANTTLAHMFGKSDYRTYFYGAWALGPAAPFDPLSRGFQHASFFEAAAGDTLTDAWGCSGEKIQVTLGKNDSNKPVFAVLAEGRHLGRAAIMHQLAAWLKTDHRPAVVMVVETTPVEKFQYHQPATWSCYTRGDLENNPHAQTDWQLHRDLRNMAGFKVEKKPNVTIFHKANWPLTDSPEQHRHRGSLVIGHGYALAGGIHLYPTAGLVPDFSRELDLSKHPQEHQRLLKTFGKWWLETGQALHDPRAFEVGKTDGESTLLTALDWRSSKIIHTDGTTLLSAPMVYQKNLTSILDGLKSNRDYKEKFPAYSGSWAVNIVRPGRYKITASLLPTTTKDPAHRKLMKLNGGSAHIRLGRNEVRLRLIKGASSVSVKTDADAGVTDLECWFTGQLALTRELGAFFVEIERVGDKKFDLKPK